MHANLDRRYHNQCKCTIAYNYYIKQCRTLLYIAWDVLSAIRYFKKIGYKTELYEDSCTSEDDLRAENDYEF